MRRARESRPRAAARSNALWTAWMAGLVAAVAAAPLRAASPESEEYRGEDPPAGEASPTRDPASPATAVDSAPATTADGIPGAAGSPPSGASEAAPSASGNPKAASPARLRRPLPEAGGPRRLLALLPVSAARGERPGESELETVGEALRMGAEQTGRYRILSQEETARPFGRSGAPRDCFAEACAAKAARRLGTDFLLIAEYAPPAGDLPDRPGSAALSLALLDARTGWVARAVKARACPGSPGPIPFAQQAVWRLLLPADSAAPGPAEGPEAAAGGCELVEEMSVDSGSWVRIPWLNPPGAADNRLRWAAAGGGMLAAGLALAWVQGQLLGEDPNASLPGAPLLSGDGADSWLRGFFAAPNPGARVAALGGAGLALPGEAGAVVLNPAALADRDREGNSAARRNLPGGAPSFHLAYAGPLKGGLAQGLAVQHEGDDLANETTLHAGLAGDWGALSPALAGIRSGAALKGYLAKVGSGGTGADRSTGHSVGLGLDLGLKARLSPRVSAAAAVRDALGFLRHTNTFTNRDYWELLPPEYRLGVAYQVDPTLVLALDGQKGMAADQVDHVRLGAEKYVFRFLAARAGLHQAFGRQAVRKLAAGFGIDSEGLSDRPLRGRVSLNYAYDFGLDEDAPLGTGQSFSLEASW